MDLFCPHCTRRVSVSDDMAGQVADCPLCTKQFKTPMLTAPPKPSAPPVLVQPSPLDTFDVSPPPVLSSPSAPVQSTILNPPKVPAKANAEEADGQYTRSLQVTLSTTWLAFVPTACIGLIFVMSFFPWHYQPGALAPAAQKNSQKDSIPSATLWTLPYSDAGVKPAYLAFVLLLVLLMLATPSIAVMDLKRGEAPANNDTLVKWAHLAVAILFTLGYFLLLAGWLLVNFVTKDESLGIGLEAALLLQFIGMLAAFGLFWLSKRKPANLPPPRLKIRW